MHRGHYCKVCGEHKANEKFSGKGHTAHICKSCMKLAPDERSKEVTLRRIDGMAFSKSNESEIMWLRNKMKDKDAQIRDAACEVHRFKFPHHERNVLKKNLHVKSLELFIHGDVWDEYGDEIPVHVLISLNAAGDLCHVDYSAAETQRKTEKTIESSTTRKLFKVIVNQLEAPFWKEDLSDDEYSHDPYIDILPGYFGDEDEYFLEEMDQKESSEKDEETPEGKDPLWSLSLELDKGETHQTVFFNQMHDEPQELYWMLIALLEDEAWFEQ